MRYAHAVAFLMVDVNRFKEINDRFGHQLGDRVLQAVADVLRQNVRECDTVIRYGGDEFLVILPETNGKADVAVERIHAAIARRNVENPLLEFPVTLAIRHRPLAADRSAAH
jgi:diguanylate cyclase (GGDEF)-like protein